MFGGSDNPLSGRRYQDARSLRASSVQIQGIQSHTDLLYITGAVAFLDVHGTFVLCIGQGGHAAGWLSQA